MNKYEIKRNDILGPSFGYRKYKEDDLYRVRPHSSEYYLLLANNALYDELERSGKNTGEDFSKEEIWTKLSPDDYFELESAQRYRKAHKDFIVCEKCGSKMHRSPEMEMSFYPNVIYYCPKCGCTIRTRYIAKDSPCENYTHPVEM